MNPNEAKKAMNQAMRDFKETPSAFFYRALEKAMRDYQDAAWFGPKS